jgi:hypothetical protein
MPQLRRASSLSAKGVAFSPVYVGCARARTADPQRDKGA